MKTPLNGSEWFLEGIVHAGDAHIRYRTLHLHVVEAQAQPKTETLEIGDVEIGTLVPIAPEPGSKRYRITFNDVESFQVQYEALIPYDEINPEGREEPLWIQPESYYRTLIERNGYAEIGSGPYEQYRLFTMHEVIDVMARQAPEFTELGPERKKDAV